MNKELQNYLFSPFNHQQLYQKIDILKVNQPTNIKPINIKPTTAKSTNIKPTDFFLFQPTRVILASDENHKYIQFWELVATHWKKYHNIQPTLFFIGSPDISLNKTIGDVIFIPPLPGIPNSLMAQLIRLIGPALFPDDVCVIGDIDMFLLDTSFFKRYLKSVPKDHIVSLCRYPLPINKTSEYRLSMCYQIGLGKTFAEVFGVEEYNVTSLLNLIAQWTHQSYSWNTDEIILTQTLKVWNKKWNKSRHHIIYTPHLWGKSKNIKSISKYNKYKTLEAVDVKKIESNHFIEFEPPQPVIQHLSFINSILTSKWKDFKMPLITYLGEDTGPSRHPADIKKI